MQVTSGSRCVHNSAVLAVPARPVITSHSHTLLKTNPSLSRFYTVCCCGRCCLTPAARLPTAHPTHPLSTNTTIGRQPLRRAAAVLAPRHPAAWRRPAMLPRAVHLTAAPAADIVTPVTVCAAAVRVTLPICFVRLSPAAPLLLLTLPLPQWLLLLLLNGVGIRLPLVLPPSQGTGCYAVQASNSCCWQVLHGATARHENSHCDRCFMLLEAVSAHAKLSCGAGTQLMQSYGKPVLVNDDAAATITCSHICLTLMTTTGFDPHNAP